MKPTPISSVQLIDFFEARLIPSITHELTHKPRRLLNGYFRSKIGCALKANLDKGINEIILCFDSLNSKGRTRVITKSLVHACAAACWSYNLTPRLITSNWFQARTIKGEVMEINNMRRNKIMLVFEDASVKS